MYRYNYELKLDGSTSYINFYSEKYVNEEYLEEEILRLYKTGEYTEIDWEDGRNYVNTYNMNRDLVKKHSDWYIENSKIKNVHGIVELG